MNDPTIPFIRRYGEWAILGAAQRSAAGWRKSRYKDNTLEVPENKRYLAANSAKRDPNAPQGARFPARPSKRDHAPTPDDDNDDNDNDNDDDDDGRIPILPPGPPTLSNPVGFPDGGGWNPAPLFNYPTRPVPNSSQLPFGSFGSFPQMQAPTPTSSIIPGGLVDPQSFPSSGTLPNVEYWKNPLSCACTSITPPIPCS